jgi:hypothetical protein
LCTSRPTPGGGGELRITSDRRRPDIESAPEGRDRALMIHFLARLGISSDARVERREVEVTSNNRSAPTWAALRNLIG